VTLRPWLNRRKLIGLLMFQKFKITPKLDLPVGKNLMDHPVVLFLPILIDKPLSVLPHKELGLQTFLEYFQNGSGKSS
jgi:hypothetical protein